MTDARTTILTPAGRLIMGDCFTPNTTDMEGKPLTTRGGEPRVDYFIGLAVPKTDPGAAELVQQIHIQAQHDFPNLFDAAGRCTLDTFAFKYIDGDSTKPNRAGKRPCDKEGFPGHIVFMFSSSYAPECWTTGGGAVIKDPEQIKRGYYIRVYGSVVGNNPSPSPGVYLNHNMVELVGYGEVIKGGADGAVVFGGAPAALPSGASATPVAPSAQMAHPATHAAPPTAPAPPAPPAATIEQVPSFLQGPLPDAEAGYICDGKSWTRTALIAAGWPTGTIDKLPRG